MHTHALKAYISTAPNEIVASTAVFHSTFIMLVVFPRFARLSRVFRRARRQKTGERRLVYIWYVDAGTDDSPEPVYALCLGPVFRPSFVDFPCLLGNWTDCAMDCCAYDRATDSAAEQFNGQ